ncbi:MAG: kelch repeat-containing protein [Saprospiraceae bacterium]
MFTQKLILLLISAFLQTTLFAQVWIQKTSLPDSAFGRHHPVTFSINGYGYLLGGSATQSPYLSDFYRYDPIADAWTKLPDFPAPPRSYSYAVVYNGKAYMGFGFGPASDMNDLWEYDSATGIWTEKSLCPGNGRGHPAFLEANGIIYVGLGGSSMGNLQDFWAYNIATDQWVQKPNFPSHKRHHPFYFSIGEMVYVGFGHGNEMVSGSTIYNDFYQFDPQNDTWKRMNDFPAEQRVAGTQFSHDGKGYVLSGEGADHNYLEEGEFWEYHPGSDNWVQLPSMPGGGRWAPGSFVIGNTVYATCGTALVDNGNSENQSDLWAYQFANISGTDISSDILKTIEVFPSPAHDLIFIRGNWKENTRFQLISADGQVMRHGQYDTRGIDVATLPEGVYGLLLENEKKGLYARFVKQ